MNEYPEQMTANPPIPALKPTLLGDTDLLDMNSLWIGDQLRPLQVLCLLSAVKQGHAVRLFTYRNYPSLPSEIEQADANQIVAESEIWLHSKTGSPGPFADRFRYELIAKGFGAWMDTDQLFLRPVRTQTDHLSC